MRKPKSSTIIMPDLNYLEYQRANMARKGTPFLDTEQAAAYLYVSARTLQTWRAKSEGPIFRKHSRFVRYHIDDLDLWSQRSAKFRKP
ncbi:MAG: helix-turn-helix domain-containing protein [Sphingorhabdus sp.]